MHSSWMRIAHLLTVSQHALLGGVPARGWEGVYLLGCVCTCSGYLPRYPPPPVNRMTDRCKNITLPQTSFAGGKKIAAEGSRKDYMLLAPPPPLPIRWMRYCSETHKRPSTNRCNCTTWIS